MIYRLHGESKSIISKVWLDVELGTYSVTFSIVSRNHKKSLFQREWDAYWDYQLSLNIAYDLGASRRSCLRQYQSTTTYSGHIRRKGRSWWSIAFMDSLNQLYQSVELETHSVSFSIVSRNRIKSFSRTKWDAYWDYQLFLRVASEVGISCRSCLCQYLPTSTTHVGDENSSYS